MGAGPALRAWDRTARRSGREWRRAVSRAHRTERSRHRGDHPSRTPFRRISRTQLERNHSEATAGGLVLFTPVYRHGCCAQGSSLNLWKLWITAWWGGMVGHDFVDISIRWRKHRVAHRGCMAAVEETSSCSLWTNRRCGGEVAPRRSISGGGVPRMRPSFLGHPSDIEGGAGKIVMSLHFERCRDRAAAQPDPAIHPSRQNGHRGGSELCRMVVLPCAGAADPRGRPRARGRRCGRVVSTALNRPSPTVVEGDLRCAH